jgi:hypothetical protein
MMNKIHQIQHFLAHIGTYKSKREIMAVTILHELSREAKDVTFLKNGKPKLSASRRKRKPS